MLAFNNFLPEFPQKSPEFCLNLSIKFSGTISNSLGKIKKRLVKEMIYGIQASKDVKLSNICRSFKEDIPLIKTEDRPSKNLASEDISEQLNDEIMRQGKNKIDQTMVIAIDPGDIMKPYAKEMEKLCNIYDGSQGKPARGYHLCQVTGVKLTYIIFCSSKITKAAY